MRARSNIQLPGIGSLTALQATSKTAQNAFENGRKRSKTVENGGKTARNLPHEAREHVRGRRVGTEAGVHGEPHGEAQPDVGASPNKVGVSRCSESFSSRDRPFLWFFVAKVGPNTIFQWPK